MPEPRPADWRDALLTELTDGPEPALRDPQHGRGPQGYTPRLAVRWGVGPVAGHRVVAARWDFGVHGGSFGEADATAFSDAVDAAVTGGLPLVSFLRSGGTRLQEGTPAVVGIARSRLALHRLADAGMPHLAVCDHPTTGGVWIGIGSGADLRVAVEGATIGFAGPRVVTAVTGSEVGADSHTAQSAYAAGLVDAVLPPDAVGAWLDTALTVLTAGLVHPANEPRPVTDSSSELSEPHGLSALHGVPAPPPSDNPRWGGSSADAQDVDGADQVGRARARHVGGGQLLTALLTDRTSLSAPHGDTTVMACVGSLAGRPVVGVALAAELDGRPTPDGYRLLTRAAELADRLALPLLTLVDTSGAEPGPVAEADGIAAAIATGMDAVLACGAPTVAVVHGEGGSGGALAAAVADVVLMTPESYFTALGPEGAAAALRTTSEDAARMLRLTPYDALANGFAVALAPAHPAELGARLAAVLDDLKITDWQRRRDLRATRWSSPLRCVDRASQSGDGTGELADGRAPEN